MILMKLNLDGLVQHRKQIIVNNQYRTLINLHGEINVIISSFVKGSTKRLVFVKLICLFQVSKIILLILYI